MLHANFTAQSSKEPELLPTEVSRCGNGNFVLFAAVTLTLNRWYGRVYVNLCSAIVTNVSNALRTLVPRKHPSFQALFEGAKVLLCAEVIGQRVPNHRAVHSKCSAAKCGEAYLLQISPQTNKELSMLRLSKVIYYIHTYKTLPHHFAVDNKNIKVKQVETATITMMALTETVHMSPVTMRQFK